MMVDAVVKSTDIEKRQKHGRSPAYPALSIKTSLEKAKALYDAEGKYAVPMRSAFAAWGFGEKSSGGREARAALRYYGLIAIEGDGEVGKVKLTDDALRVLLDEREDQSEKKAIIRRLALNPPVHKKLFEKFPDGIKSTATVEHFLIFDEGYNKTAASEIVKEFKETATFVDLFKPDNSLDKSGENVKNASASPKYQIEVGDLVQVEIGGAHQLEKPARVRAVQEHEGQKWVFIEGSETGIEMEQVIVQQKGIGAAKAPPILAEDKTAPKPGMNEEKNSLDEGEAVLIWPENLSAESVGDLEYWLQGILKKAKRRAGVFDQNEKKN